MIIHVRRPPAEGREGDGSRASTPTGPLHPEIYRFHRESAIGDTQEEAVALAKERALRPLYQEKMAIKATV